MKRRTRFVLSVAAGLLAVLVAVLYTSSVRSEAEQAKAETMARYGGDLVDVCEHARYRARGDDRRCKRAH